MKHSKNNLSFFFGILTAAVLIYAATVFLAPAPTNAELIPACSASGACGVCDIIGVFITLGKWLVTGAAGLALVVIINAGVTMATSAGNPEKVGAGKKGILGAVIGLGAVLMAFQFVSLVIFLVVTPSNLQTFEATQEGTAQNKEQGARASLASFLGIPWWQICSQDELIAKGGKATGLSTANCQYWGDDTACGANSICCKGKCEPGMKPARQGPDGKDIPSDCPLFTQVSATRPDLAQEPGETGGGAQGGAGGPAVCKIGYDANEQQARDRIAAIGGIDINNGGINGGQACGNSTFKAYRSACTGGCTNVGGLQSKVFDYLRTIKNKCGGFTVTGGSELGHTVGGAHDNGLAVDIRPSDYSTFGNCLKRGIGDGSLSFIRQICTQAGDAVFRHSCPNVNEAERHFHLSFN